MFNGQIVKQQRLEIGISQKKFAELLGIRNTYLSDIENLRKIPSNKLQKKMKKILSKYSVYSKTSEPKYTKKQLNNFEKEIVNTYNLMKNEKNVFANIAAVNRELIELNKFLQEIFLKLDGLIDINNENLMRKITRPIKTTIRNLENKKEALENLLDYNIEMIKTYEEN